MTRLDEQAKRLHGDEMAAARLAQTPDLRWHHLERAHIISQPDPWRHTCNHGAMLDLALRQHDRREALGVASTKVVYELSLIHI